MYVAHEASFHLRQSSLSRQLVVKNSFILQSFSCLQRHSREARQDRINLTLVYEMTLLCVQRAAFGYYDGEQIIGAET